MANSFFNLGREHFATAQIDWVDDDINVNLVDAEDYTVDLVNHGFLDDIPGGAIVSTAALANKTATGGVLDADDTTLTTVAGDQAEALVINKDTGTPATSVLILYLDQATGLPVTPNGGDMIIAWSSSSSRIARL